MGTFVAYTAGAAIPIGIAVGRQRLQEATTNQTIPQLQPKDLNRFGLGLADLGEFSLIFFTIERSLGCRRFDGPRKRNHFGGK